MSIDLYSGLIPNRATQDQATYSGARDSLDAYFLGQFVPQVNAVAVGAISSGVTNALEINSDGSAAAPTIRFGSEATTGWHRVGAGQWGFSILGALKYTFGATTFAYAGTTMTIGGGQVYRAGVPLGVVGAIIEDQKTSGTNAGGFTSGADRIRELTTFANNDLGLAALSSNRFTLPAGTYKIDFSAPGHNVGTHQALLYNVTDAVEVKRGTSMRCAPAAFISNHSFGSAIVTIAGSKAFEIRHRCSDTFATNGLGIAAGFGTEIYTRVEITKIA